MNVKIGDNQLKLWQGDITTLQVDAIVNAANGSLLGGGGVDGAIHRAAGPALREECRRIREEQLQGEYLPTGDAVITKGYNLPAKHVIHTVGPIWDGEDQEIKKNQLSNCYRNALNLAKEHNLQSIAFPSISTGAYRFPIDLASEIALATIIEFLKKETFGEVTMALFSPNDLQVYENTLNKLLESEAVDQ